MHSEYIEQRKRGYYVAGTRISLDSVVYSFNGGSRLRPFRKTSVAQALPDLRCDRLLPGPPGRGRQVSRTGKARIRGNAIPLEQANPSLWAKIQRAKAEAAQGERRS